MIVLRQKQYTRAEKEAMFQLMRLTKGFKSLPKSLNSVENAKRFKKFSNRLVKFANDPEAHKFTAEELKEMKGFLNDIGATKFADNFEPIVNKYYGNNNIDAWKRLRFREEKLPANKALVNRYDRLGKRERYEWKIQNEIESHIKNLKSIKGKSSKEIFSSPDGKLMKNIIKGETGGVGQPGFYFNNVKGRRKITNLTVNNFDKESEYTKKELLKRVKSALQGKEDFSIDGGHGNVLLSHADPSILSHELGHVKSLANSITAGTPVKETVDLPKKLIEVNVSKLPKRRARAMYNRLDDLSTIAEENMANAYGRDIIRKYGGKNVDKYLADYEKMVENMNMKSYLSSARENDVRRNVNILYDIRSKV